MGTAHGAHQTEVGAVEGWGAWKRLEAGSALPAIQKIAEDDRLPYMPTDVQQLCTLRQRCSHHLGVRSHWEGSEGPAARGPRSAARSP